MKILMLHRQQSAVGYYRTQLPARALTKAGHQVTSFSEPYFKALKPQAKPKDGIHQAEVWLAEHLGEYDLLVTDRAWYWSEAAMFAGYRHYSPGSRLIVDFDDDFTNVPSWNMAHGKYEPGMEMREAGLAHLRLAELATVSTEQLMKTFGPKTHSIVVAKNHIDPSDWNFPVNPERANDPGIRILYGGASGHYGDLDEARAGLEIVLRNPPVPIKFICFGALPNWIYELKRELPEGRIVDLPWIPFEHYPQVIAWGGFDLAIAPLATDILFNESKSAVKWLEAGLQGIPLLCSDVGPYKRDIPKGCAVKVDNTLAQWSEGLSALLTDSKLRASIKDRAFQAVMDGWRADKPAYEAGWDSIVMEAMARPRIETLEQTRLPGDPLNVESDSNNAAHIEQGATVDRRDGGPSS